MVRNWTVAWESCLMTGLQRAAASTKLKEMMFGAGPLQALLGPGQSPASQ
jgi:hypothetical protein